VLKQSISFDLVDPPTAEEFEETFALFWGNAALHALLEDDEQRAAEVLAYFPPDRLQDLALAAKRLARLCETVDLDG